MPTRDIQIPKPLKYLFCSTRGEPTPSYIQDNHLSGPF